MLVFLVSIFVLAGVDQLTKYLVVKLLKDAGTKTILKGLLNFSYVENRGAAFSMMQNARWIFLAITAVALVAIFWYYLKKRPAKPLLNVSLILLAGGAIGNFIDRLFFGYVVDFIKFSFFNFTCNVADIYLTFGVILLLIYIFFFDKDEKKHAK